MNKSVLLSFISVMLLSGCQVVSVKNQALNVSIANERDSILTRSQLSEASLNVLSMTGREAKNCVLEPQQCVQNLKDTPQIQDEQLLSTASELFLAKAIELDKSVECKTSLLSRSEEQKKLAQQQREQCLEQQLGMLDQSIRYSYAYMFHTKRAPQDRIFDNRQVQIRDFYNQAIAKMVSIYAVRYQPNTVPKTIQIGQSRYHLNLEYYPELKNQPIEQLLSTYNLNFSGLRSITRRDGFGAEFALVLPDPSANATEKPKYIIDPLNYAYHAGRNPNIHSPRYLAATITAQPRRANSIDMILKTSEFELTTYDPYKYEQVEINRIQYPLAANFSAPYGLWLAQDGLGKSAYLSLIDRDDRLTMPHLYMLEPYNPNKKVIVLVHGLASSPEAWVRLTNDIMGDPVLRENYQVWQVFYSTNMPIIESRFQIHALLTQAFQQIQPSAAAKKEAVLIGHSMGGIIARLLVSNANVTQQALTNMNARQLEQYRNIPIVRQRMIMQDIPNFSRAIFLAAPHRGTEFADLWFTKAARKIIKLPGNFLTAVGDAIQDEDPSIKNLWKSMNKNIMQNGPSNLSQQSNFIRLTADIVPRAGLPYHSIIGNNTGSSDPQLINDDVVPYQSAHLAGAVSEKLIVGSHSIQETPEAVLELRRILRLHLIQLGLYKPA